MSNYLDFSVIRIFLCDPEFFMIIAKLDHE